MSESNAEFAAGSSGSITGPMCPDRRRFLRLAATILPVFIGRPLLGEVKPVAVGSDVSFITESVPLLRRSTWARRAPERARLRALGECNRITIHHQGAAVFKASGKDAVVAQINNVYSAHRDQRYGDIGYHFIVDYAGRLWEGRSIDYEGAHVSARNSHNLAVMVLGNFQEQKASREQMDMVLKIVALLQRKYKVEASRIYGHLDLGSTICPGRNMYPAVRLARANAERSLKQTRP